ncbi:hypothetical protein [Methylococcus sp. Mc7]|jgi:hypothetical protein|uniref:hypothetical protein n=1 Tax=Methylococcus sp. Mc7 TaxID=2860258 RepID=UPI001C5317FF|nr:hypothetical protein [Methylococcus sp. Mc7]QXP85227.1 hypothetical protein KW115_05745 [Methylococcus sp. Mc7]
MGTQNDTGTQECTEFMPIGTWTLMCMIAAMMVAAWLFLYFGIFLPRGSVQ